MLTTRRSGDLTRSSPKNKRACNAGGETTKSLTSGDLPGDSNQDILTELSDEVALKLSKSVVSLAVSDGDRVFFACSGIAVDRQDHFTRFVTSAGLGRAIKRRYKDGNLKIEVHHGGNQVHSGFLPKDYFSSHRYSDCNLVVVDVMAFLDIHVVRHECAEEILPNGNVVAAGRDISGKLKARSVMLAGDLSRPEEIDENMFSKYNSEAWEGGPLFDGNGNFVGMNVLLVMEKSFFLPWGVILKWLDKYWTSGPLHKMAYYPLPLRSWPVRSRKRSTGDISKCHLEENFGDVFGKGVWMRFNETVASDINHSVVALASFNGETKFFACTGFFIEWNGSTPILTSASLVRSSDGENKIHENLRIEVLLPDKQRREGTLQHCSLHYNIALIVVKNYRALSTVNADTVYDNYSEVVAVGRCFSSGTLMAARKNVNINSGTLDCRFLTYSSCKISKVGIGGPLVGCRNNVWKVIGLNFYDKKKIGTPFFAWKFIVEILAYFKEKGGSAVAEVGTDDPSGSSHWKIVESDGSVHPNRWPLPEDDSEDDSEDEARFGRPASSSLNGVNVQYFHPRPIKAYINGQKWYLR